jgi:hypothetical protein
MRNTYTHKLAILLFHINLDTLDPVEFSISPAITTLEEQNMNQHTRPASLFGVRLPKQDKLACQLPTKVAKLHILVIINLVILCKTFTFYHVGSYAVAGYGDGARVADREGPICERSVKGLPYTVG